MVLPSCEITATRWYSSTEMNVCNVNLLSTSACGTTQAQPTYVHLVQSVIGPTECSNNLKGSELCIIVFNNLAITYCTVMFKVFSLHKIETSARMLLKSSAS